MIKLFEKTRQKRIAKLLDGVKTKLAADEKIECYTFGIIDTIF